MCTEYHDILMLKAHQEEALQVLKAALLASGKGLVLADRTDGPCCRIPPGAAKGWHGPAMASLLPQPFPRRLPWQGPGASPPNPTEGGNGRARAWRIPQHWQLIPSESRQRQQ